MIVEEKVFISEIEVSYLSLSISECSSLFIDCKMVSTGCIQIWVKRRTCVDIRISNYHRISELVSLDNNYHMFQM